MVIKMRKGRSEKNQAYPDKMLKDCLKGEICEYGICDECPNNISNYEDNDYETNESNRSNLRGLRKNIL